MDRPQSEFNMGLSYLQKISFLLWHCSLASMELDMNSWFLSLKALKRTIITEMTEKDLDEVKALEEEIKVLLSKYLLQQRKKLKTNVPENLFELLEKYEMKIYFVLKDAGLLNKLKTSAELSIGQGEKW